MVSHHCNINTFLLVLFVVIIIAYTDSIFKNAPIFKKLFTDQLNYILLIILVILILLIDIPNGIVLAFLVLYLSVQINYNTNATMTKNRINNKSKVAFSDIKTIIPLKNNTNKGPNDSFSSTPSNLSNPSLNYSSESEFFYNNNKPFPNNNLKPFESTNKPVSNNETTNLPINSNIINENALLDRDGFDVSGCRYDFKNSPQNLTKYGPPLSQCSAYDTNKLKSCGTLFYPLNA